MYVDVRDLIGGVFVICLLVIAYTFGKAAMAIQVSERIRSGEFESYTKDKEATP